MTLLAHCIFKCGSFVENFEYFYFVILFQTQTIDAISIKIQTIWKLRQTF